MGMTLLGLPNILAKDYCTFSTDGFAGLEPAGLEASNLKTEEPSEVARLNSLIPSHTRWLFSLSDLEQSMSGFALGNHNLTTGSYVRFINGEREIFSNSPNAVVLTNSTGLVTSVDESIDSPDGSVIGPTVVDLTWSGRFSFEAFTTPRLGTAMGQVVVIMKRVFFGAGATTSISYPVVYMDLYESGSLVTSLGYRALTTSASSSQVFVFPFDFADLANTSGSNFECKITVRPGVAPTVDDGSYGTLDTLIVFHEGNAEDNIGDSGYIEIPESGSVDAPTKSIHYLTSGDWAVTSGTIAVLSDQSVHNPPLVFGGAKIPIGAIKVLPDIFIQAGIAVGSEKFELSTGIQSDGPQVNVEVEEITGNTIGGQTYGADSFRRRICDPTTIVVSREEKDFLMSIAWEQGHSGAFYVILESGLDIARQLFTSFWATLKSLSTPRQLMLQGNEEAKYSMTIAFEEKL